MLCNQGEHKISGAETNLTNQTPIFIINVSRQYRKPVGANMYQYKYVPINVFAVSDLKLGL